MARAQEYRTTPWELTGKNNPDYWTRIQWRKRWELWTSERNAREQRMIDEMNLRRMQNG